MRVQRPSPFTSFCSSLDIPFPSHARNPPHPPEVDSSFYSSPSISPPLLDIFSYGWFGWDETNFILVSSPWDMRNPIFFSHVTLSKLCFLEAGVPCSVKARVFFNAWRWKKFLTERCGFSASGFFKLLYTIVTVALLICF